MFQLYVYGLVVRVVLRAPSIYSSTLLTELAESVAVAVMVVVPGADTEEPLAGAVTETVGGVESVTKVPPPVIDRAVIKLV